MRRESSQWGMRRTGRYKVVRIWVGEESIARAVADNDDVNRNLHTKKKSCVTEARDWVKLGI